jgi:hypothetical protein
VEVFACDLLVEEEVCAVFEAQSLLEGEQVSFVERWGGWVCVVGEPFPCLGVELFL